MKLPHPGPARLSALLAGVVAWTLLAGLGAAAGSPAGAGHPADPAAAGTAFVNVSATSSLSFVPGSFSVAPGQSVRLVVTQLANFNHTFTLSSVVNFTIPSTDTPEQVAAFFNAHPPLVNQSLGSTPGAKFPLTFTAPSTPGTYEFVCLIHFPTMVGVMVDANSTTSPPGPTGITTIEYVALGAGVVIVVIAAVALLSRRRRAPPPHP